MTILFLLFLFLDLQHPPVPDSPNQDFNVTDVTEPSLAGCAMNPSDGNGQCPADLTVDWADPFKDQTPTPSPLALQESPSLTTVTSMRMNPDYPPIPPSNPEPPQPVTTPEPPTIAILTLTGLALLYLMFGYSRRQRLYRRFR
jgi:hypothetical protein